MSFRGAVLRKSGKDSATPLPILLRLALIAGAAVSAAPVSAQGLPVATRSQNASVAENLTLKHRFADCVVREHRDLVVLMLEQLAGSPGERRAFGALRTAWSNAAQRGEPSSCTIRLTGGDISSTPLSLRGALTEALQTIDFAAPAPPPRRGQRRSPAGGSVSFARIPAGFEPEDGQAGGAADAADGFRRFAACAVARVPAVSIRLLETTPGAAEERREFEQLVAGQEGCFRGEGGYDINIPSLRDAVAEAVYRRSAAAARGETTSAPVPVTRVRAARLVVDEHAGGTATGAAGIRRLNLDDARAINEFAQCAANALPQDAEQALARFLAGDDRDPGLYRLAQRRWMCSPEGRPLLFSRTLFAGGVAEALLKQARGGAVSAASRALGASAAAGARSQPEQVASCIVRTSPGAVGLLLATPPASLDETRALASMLPTGQACVPSDYRVSTSRSALRALMAIAAYRHSRADPMDSN